MTLTFSNQVQICPCDGAPVVCLPGQAIIGPGTPLVQRVIVPPGTVLQLTAWNIPIGGSVTVYLFDGAECASGLTIPFAPCGTETPLSLTPSSRVLYLGAGMYQLVATGLASNYLVKPAAALLRLADVNLRELQCACPCAPPPVIIPTADVAVTNVFNPATVTVGGITTKTITIANNGPAPANGATISDTLPASLTGGATTWSYAGGAAGGSGTLPVLTVATLPVGGVATVSFPVTTSAVGQFTNIATVAPPTGTFDPIPANNTAPASGQTGAATVVVVPVPITTADVAVTNTFNPTTVTVGGVTTKTLTITNYGPAIANGATIADALPAGLSGGTLTWSYSGGAAGGSGTLPNLTVATLPVGGVATVSFPVTTSAAGTFTNIATVAPPAGLTDPVPANNTAPSQGQTGAATVVVTPVATADVAVTNTFNPTTVPLGSITTKTITITNNGPLVANGATISDTLPATLTGGTLTWTYSGGAAGGSGTLPNLTVATLPVGGVATVSFPVTTSATGTFTNIATVATPTGLTDPVPGNNTAPSQGQTGAATVVVIPATQRCLTAVSFDAPMALLGQTLTDYDGDNTIETQKRYSITAFSATSITFPASFGLGGTAGGGYAVYAPLPAMGGAGDVNVVVDRVWGAYGASVLFLDTATNTWVNVPPVLPVPLGTGSFSTSLATVEFADGTAATPVFDNAGLSGAGVDTYLLTAAAASAARAGTLAVFVPGLGYTPGLPNPPTEPDILNYICVQSV